MKHFRHQSRPKKNTLIAGLQQVMHALHQATPLDRIYVNSKVHHQMVQEVKQAAAAQGVPVQFVPVEKLRSFNIPNFDECVAVIAKVQYYELQQVISWVVEKGEVPLFLILDGITDVRNIGGIARTAFCTGVHALIIPDKGIGALNEDAILTSAGALEKLAVCRVPSLMKAVDELHLNGITVLATEMKAAKNVFEHNFTGPVAVVMGSEEKGIYPALLKICDERLKIPMMHQFESLNVSVATGIILYEAMKQRIFSAGIAAV